MLFKENEKKHWVCDHCLRIIGNTDNEVMFYRTWHFHKDCLEKGKPQADLYLKAFGGKNVHRNKKR